MKFVVHLLLLTLLSALSGAAWVAQRPVDERGEVESADSPVVDVGEQIRQATIKRTAVVDISEGTLNRYLSDRLSGEMREEISDYVAFDGLSVDLHDGWARFDLEWKLGGQRRTVSVSVSVSREGDVFRVHVNGGAYGRLEVIRGFLRPMVPTFQRVSAVFEKEIGQLFRMNKVEIQEGRLVLDPRF